MKNMFYNIFFDLFGNMQNFIKFRFEEMKAK